MNQLVKIDLAFLTLILLLSFYGILMIFSTNSSLAANQLAFFLFGFSLFFLIGLINYRIFKNLAIFFYLANLLLLLVVFAVGEEIRGAVRWIDLGFVRFQPSELAKLTLIVALAAFFTDKAEIKFGDFLKSSAIVLPYFLIVFRQPDLGSAVILLLIWAILIFVAGASAKYIIGGIFAGGVVLPAVWYFLASYQKLRLISFLNPEFDPLGAGFAAAQSQIAIGSGQIIGRGFGHGPQSQLQFLPEHSTDFIFASLSEELGLLGAGILFILFFLLFFRILKIVKNSSDRFAQLLAVGVCFWLAFQALVNIGMNLGLLPVAGVTLPLISYGGSSLITTFLGLGLIASIDRFSPKAAASG